MDGKNLSEETTFGQRHDWGNVIRKQMVIPSRVNTSAKALESEWALGVQRGEKSKVQVAEAEWAT